METIPAEPEDGTLVVVKYSWIPQYQAIWRDDAKAAEWVGGFPDERWFDDIGDGDPTTWVARVADADAVFTLAPLAGGDAPLVESWTERRLVYPSGRRGPWHPTTLPGGDSDYPDGYAIEERTVIASEPRRLPTP